MSYFWNSQALINAAYLVAGVLFILSLRGLSSQVTALWPLLRRPVFGQVVLAGEHTDRFQGWMEGAVRSGRRAAARSRRTGPVRCRVSK